MASVTPATKSGILLVDKEGDWTSHDVVAKVRGLAGTRKVGHAGTLDPMATGLLVVGINSATRLLTYLTGCDKVYEATIRLGASTSTDDAEGEVLGYAPASALQRVTLVDIEAGIARLTGDISQVPSSVSAIKVNGERAYARVRSGETVELAPRPVTVSRFDAQDIRFDVDDRHLIDVDVVVACSSGTYIRALARDLGFSLGVGGHLTRLRRTRVGPFDVVDAHTLADPHLIGNLVPNALAAQRLFPVIELSTECARDLMHGKRPEFEHVDSPGPFSAVSPQGTLIGLVKVESGKLVSLVNFPADE
ncbi:MAG: tRNA pseudouridine(55) synthase TruB [Microbacteriaceae bacterium]|nr:tRNA pseudouridine(55) synthase TruB [Microbacteriaceae bacterium]